MKSIKNSLLTIAVSIVAASTANAAVIGKVDSNFKLIGPNSSIQVESLVDPEVSGMACHISYAKQGGISGAIGLAEERSRFSLACRQTGQLVLAPNIKKQKKVDAFDRNIFFKEMIVTRMFDQEHNTLIYLVNSKGLIEGSPFNAISTVPLAPWGAKEVIFK